MRPTRKLALLGSCALAMSALAIIPATSASATTLLGLAVFYPPNIDNSLIYVTPGGQNNEVLARTPAQVGNEVPLWYQPTSGGYAQIRQNGTNLCLQMWASNPYNGGYAVTETPCAALTGQEWADVPTGDINGVTVATFNNKSNQFCLSWDESAETFYARSCGVPQWYQLIYSEP
jgi:hypothetical protein